MRQNLTSRVPRIRAAGVALAAIAAVASLAGCGSGTSSAPPASPSTAPSLGTSAATAAQSPSANATTAPGTQLLLGTAATVAWRPNSKVTGLLALSVDSIRSTTFARSFKGWKLTTTTVETAPYFVTVTVTNRGTVALNGGLPTPLYALDNANELVQASTFKQAFPACEPSTLPVRFMPGQSAKVCMVFLVPKKASLLGISFRPDQNLAPILWKGQVVPLAPAASAKPKSKK